MLLRECCISKTQRQFRRDMVIEQQHNGDPGRPEKGKARPAGRPFPEAQENREAQQNDEGIHEQNSFYERGRVPGRKKTATTTCTSIYTVDPLLGKVKRKKTGQHLGGMLFHALTIVMRKHHFLAPPETL